MQSTIASPSAMENGENTSTRMNAALPNPRSSGVGDQATELAVRQPTRRHSEQILPLSKFSIPNIAPSMTPLGSQTNLQATSSETPIANATTCHWLTLRFNDQSIESEYTKHCDDTTPRRQWKWFIVLYGACGILAYICIIISLSIRSDTNDPKDTLLTSSYDPIVDILLLIFGWIMPLVVLLALIAQLEKAKRQRHIVHAAAIVNFVMISIGLLGHWFLVELKTTPAAAYAFFIPSVMIFHISNNVPFVVGFASVVSLSTSYFILAGIRSYNQYPIQFTYVIVSLIITSITTIYLCYRREWSARQQFVHGRSMELANKKLMNQLKGLQNVYSRQALDFDSPMEKATILLRSLMADSHVPPAQLAIMSRIMAYLTTSNLFSPDIEHQLKEGLIRMDPQQERWLLSEITKRSNTSARSKYGAAAGSSTAADNQLRRSASHLPGRSLENVVQVIHRQMTESNVRLHRLRSDVNNSQMLVAPEDVPSLPKMRSLSKPVGRTPVAQDAPINDSAKVTVSTSALVLNNMNAPIAEQQEVMSVPDLAVTDESSKLAIPSSSKLQPMRPRAGFATTRKAINQNALLRLPNADEFVPRLTSTLQFIDQWNFPIFELQEVSENRPLSVMANYLFRRSGLFSALQLDEDKFGNFVTTIELGYRDDIPYHTCVHAADVLHATHYLTHLPDLSRWFADSDLLAIFVAAIVHDFDHPGYNNNFLVATRDEKAILYNDKSVLENYHVSGAFRELLAPENNFLTALSPAAFADFRSSVIDIVLATDLAQHFEIVAKFKSKTVADFQPLDNRSDHLLLSKIIVKCADVGNATKASDLHYRWITLVLAEFFLQGDEERLRGLPISPLMDREKVDVSSSQIGFIDFICQPLFDAMHKYSPIDEIVAGLASNRAYWAAEIERTKKNEGTADSATHK